VHRALFALQHRGQEAAGIVSWGEDGALHHLRGRGLVAATLPIHKVSALSGRLAIGHVRYSTVPADQTENIQPFMATTPFGRLALGHNGNLKNADLLRRQLEAAGSLMSTTMDTELFVHLMARSGATQLPEALRAAAKEAVGAYSLSLLCDGRVYGLRDASGVRPLSVGIFREGFIIASESCAIEAIGGTALREVNPGELIELTGDGLVSTPLLEPAPPAPCVFELVYFARPDSTAAGQGVYSARVRMGEMLARQDAARGLPKPDIVVPVPDSGVPAAVGYVRESGVPFEMAIMRSHYVGRTFILPNQDMRTHSIGLKLSVIREAVRGRRVTLIDDSLVRGNTSRQIVRMVRDAGAKEVYLRIASPPLAWPCFLGIDTPTREELVVNRFPTLDAARDFLGADDLMYLSLDGLQEATERRPFCFGCMTGSYPL
jgi:amidophosphoribosyltransferase